MSVSTVSEKVTVSYRNDSAVIRFSGDVNADRIFKLCDEVDFAINYYNYSRIRIDIDSPGGEAKALKHYLHNLKRWRKRGVTIHTRALTSCCSAGAYMLSFGDIGHRIALPHTALLYHNVRVSTGERSMTADTCDGLMWNLNTTDFGMILMLLEHLHPEIPEQYYRVMSELLCGLPDDKHGMNLDLLAKICSSKERNLLKRIEKSAAEPEALAMRRSLHGLICERLKKRGKALKVAPSGVLPAEAGESQADDEDIYAWIFRNVVSTQQDFAKDTYIRPEVAVERKLIDTIEQGEF